MSVTQGKAGGLATVRKYGTNWMSKIGSRGGNEVVGRYGSDYMSLLAQLANESLSDYRRARIQGTLRRIVRENQ